uniref:Uncharacterized protein n=1 Tax=viral metagenome TaxID=1070528 RepID=A0A6C0HC05_9ZZZZ
MLLYNIFVLFFSFGSAYFIKKVIENDYILQKLVLHNFDYLVELFNHIFIQKFYTDYDTNIFYKCIEIANTNMINFVNLVNEKAQFMSFLYLENSETEEIQEAIIEKIPEKYEDKYLDIYRKTDSVICSDEKIEGLKNMILMENTPLGNVIMYYDKSRETFIYYSDSNIPYRYLEVISRKYVVMNDCKQIHIDMDQEIKEALEKLEQRKQEEQEKRKQLEQEKQKTDENHSTTNTFVKKDVFAKLKKYNTNTSLKSSGIPTDNKSISKKNIQENDKPLILKEKANRYSCEGKLVNFSFLKKVDKKVVDKRYGMSFSDFKKMITPSSKK